MRAWQLRDLNQIPITVTSGLNGSLTIGEGGNIFSVASEPMNVPLPCVCSLSNNVGGSARLGPTVIAPLRLPCVFDAPVAISVGAAVTLAAGPYVKVSLTLPLPEAVAEIW